MGKITKKTKKPIKRTQRQIDLELAIKVSNRVQLENVRLMSCSCNQNYLSGPGKKSFDIEKSVESSIDESTNRIFVLTKFALQTYEVGDSTKESLTEIEASFLLIYQADFSDDITENAVEQFGNTNGIYNAWPYWREYVQNTIVRMGLPSLTIPVFRIFAPKKAEPPKKKVVAKKKSTAKK